MVKPQGTVLLLEHVRPRNPVLGLLTDMFTPLIRWLLCPELNRRTERNVDAAGLAITAVRREGVWREIQARPVPDENVPARGFGALVAKVDGGSLLGSTT